MATAIGGLALLMLAMAISAAVHMAMTSRDSLDEYYDASNAIAEASATSLGTGTVALVPADGGTAVSLAGDDLKARYFRFDSETAGMDSVVAYESAPGTSVSGSGGA